MSTSNSCRHCQAAQATITTKNYKKSMFLQALKTKQDEERQHRIMYIKNRRTSYRNKAFSPYQPLCLTAGIALHDSLLYLCYINPIN